MWGFGSARTPDSVVNDQVRADLFVLHNSWSANDPSSGSPHVSAVTVSRYDILLLIVRL